MKSISIVLALVSFSISSQLFSQTQGLQDRALKNRFTQLGADFSSTNINNYDEELQAIFLDMDTGPYFNESWYNVTLSTISDEIDIDDSVDFRFDTYNHELQYQTPSMEKPVELSFKFIKGFVLRDKLGREYEFIKYVGSRANLKNPRCKYYMVLGGDEHQLLKLFYSDLNIAQEYGPGKDGRVKKKFLDKTSLYYLSPDNTMNLIKAKTKDLVAQFPDLESDIRSFEKENGRIKNETQLALFFEQYL